MSRRLPTSRCRGREVVSSSLTLILDAGGQAQGHQAR